MQTLPSSKSFLLKGVLSKRFPQIKFDFKRFIKSDLSPDTGKAKSLRQEAIGIIFELKNIVKSDLKILDQAWRIYKNKPAIFILTPEGFQFLNKVRSDLLTQTSVIISETKSLDYIIQLPRFIEAIGRKNRLQTQNDRLRRLMEKTFESLAGFGLNTENPPATSREVAEGLKETAADQELCGLRVSLKGWPQVKRRLGHSGQAEVMNSVARLINTAVRNSDRVLHWKENEFLIFLSNTERNQLASCRSRVAESLSSLQLSANHRQVQLPFTVKSIEKMSFLH